MLHRLLLISVVAAALPACTETLPVKGSIGDAAPDPFTGTLVMEADSSGTMAIHSTRGRACSGTVVYTSYAEGQGVLTCADGTSGDFRFASTGSRGNGEGSLGAESLRFTFQDGDEGGFLGMF
jgi:hypothetical protein